MVNAQFEPLAKLWGVENKKVPELLDREAKLIRIDGKLQPLLNNLYFEGTYVDVKANKININTVDQSKVEKVRNSSQMKKYKKYLKFKKATNSLSQLKSTFVQIIKLAQKFNIINGIISIEPKVNNVVIYLKDKNDPKNKEFIKMEKRQIDPIILGGNEIVTWFGPRPLRCSADVANPRNIEYLIIGSTEIASTNIHVCKSGFVTGVICGHVKALDTTVLSETGPKVGVFLTSIHEVSDDSGGSTFRYSHDDYSIPLVYAVGILVSSEDPDDDSEEEDEGP
ncbi:19388_t:CDS:2, partial [Racocetra persica]